MSETNYLMEEMSWPEVESALEDVRGVLVPVGSHEQHGPHLAESSDAIRAERFAGLLGERMYPELLIAPTINLGVSQHHMAFPGTITLRPSTLQSILFDVVKSLHQHGLERFIIYNAHGGNTAPIEVAMEEIRAELDVKLVSLMHSDFVGDMIDELVESETYGHSCEYEVSEVLHLAPERVDEENLSSGEVKEFCSTYMDTEASIAADFHELTANGALGDARKASRKLGKKIIEAALDEVEKFLQAFLNDFS